MKFVTRHFDKLLLLLVFLLIFWGYIYFRFDALERMLDAVLIAIFTIVGVRRYQDAQSNTNIESDSVEVHQNTPLESEEQREEREENLYIG